MGARRTIDLDEISRPQILDPGRIQRDHLRVRCSSFVRRTTRAGPHRQPGTHARSGVRSRLCGFLELLEPKCQPIAIGTILIPPRQFDHLPDDPLEAKFGRNGPSWIRAAGLRRGLGNRDRSRLGGHRRPHDGAWSAAGHSIRPAVLAAGPHP
jgi:hypothetical protein